jgi:hypothetical protein
MTDSPYLQRSTDLDGMAVNVATTLIQALTLIHGGALVAIPAFAEQFKPIIQSPLLGRMFGLFGMGLLFAIATGIVAFFALAQRSDENLELNRTKGSRSPAADDCLKRYQRLRHVAIALVILSTACLIGAGYTSYCILVAGPRN